MADVIADLVAQISIDGSKFTKGMGQVNRQLKTVQEELKTARSRFKQTGNSTDLLGSKATTLSGKLKLQQSRLDLLNKAYKESKESTGEYSAKTQKLATQLEKAKRELGETEHELEQVNKELSAGKWKEYGEQMKTAGDKMQSVGRGMSNFGRSYSMKVTAPIVAGGIAVFKAASDWESAFTGVEKTVDGTAQEMKTLRGELRGMAKDIPASTTEIAAVAEAAGQLGIQTSNVEEFTRTMIDLGEATNMTSEQAATEFARFANIVGMSQKDFDKLGSSLVELGNNMATTEAEISEMSLRLAAQGKQVGMSEADILALAASMSSLGIKAESGGTSMTKVLKRINGAVDVGGDKLNQFAEAAGVSSEEFAKAWKDDPIKALDLFIKGLGKSGEEGENLTTILGELGIKGIRESDTLLRLAGASDILSEAVDTSTGAWKENTALTEEAEKRYETTASKLKIMWNRIKDVAITLGDSLIPAVMGAIDAAEPLIKKIESGAQAFSDMDESQQRTILKMIALVAAIGPASVVLGGLTTAIGGVFKIGGGLVGMLGKVGGAGLIGRLGMLGVSGPVGLAIAGVAGLALGIYALTKDNEELHEISMETTNALWDQAESLENLVNEFDSLQNKSRLTNDEFGRMIDIQAELEKTQNPSKVAELKDEYATLAEKSNLTNKEIDKMLELNDDIIEQSPIVEKVFTDKGSAVVVSTDAIKEYIQSLKDMSMFELNIQKEKALENEAELRQKNKDLAIEMEAVEERINELMVLRKMPLEEVKARIIEINELLQDGSVSIEEKKELTRELTSLMDVETGKAFEALEMYEEQRKKLVKKQELNEAELGQLEIINEKMVDMYLSEVDINFEKGKGLEKLDDEIIKLEQVRSEIVENTSAEQKNTQEYHDQLGKLDSSISKYKNIRDTIKEKTGYQSDGNKKQEDHNRQLSLALDEMEIMAPTQANTNRKIEDGTGEARKLTSELGKDVDKNVRVDDKGKAKKIHDKAKQSATKTITLSAAWTGVRAGLSSALRNFSLPGFADGTDHHLGGPFVAGEEGFELGRMGSRFEMLNFGMYDRPSGYEVFTHDESKKILGALNRMPAYATGASQSGEAGRVVNDLNNPQQIIEKTVAPEYVSVQVNIDGRSAAIVLAKPITDIQNKSEISRLRARGIN